MLTHKRPVLGFVGMLALAGLNSPAQTVSFSDDDFTNSDWTATVIIDETDSAKITARQALIDGNPGAFRRVIHVGDTGSAAREIYVAHLQVGATYDPQTQGPISSISYSYDLKNLESRTVWASEYHLLIFQNDTYYRSGLDRVSRLEWRSFGRSGLAPRDFIRLVGDGPRRVNFSANAPLLQFGFASVSEFPVQSGPNEDVRITEDSRNSGVDNWSLVISAAPPVELTVTSDSPLPAGMVGQPYAETLSAMGGVPPYSWSAVFGALPPGLTLDPATGSLEGNPTVPGSFQFVGLVTDTSDGAAVKEFVTLIELDPGLEPTLGAQPNRLTSTFVQVSPPATENLSVLNGGGGSLGFQVETATQSGGPWLMVSPTAGQATAAQPGMLNVTVDPASLAPGTYFGEIQIASSAAQQSMTVPVAMAISGRSQSIRVSRRGLTFTAVVGGAAAPVQPLRVFNDGIGMMPWTSRVETLSGGNWLTITPPTGASEPSFPATVDVAINSQGLSPGTYYGLLEVAAPNAANSPRFTSVVLNLLAGDQDPGPIVDPAGLIFASVPEAPTPSAQSFRILNLTNGSLPFTLRGLTLNGDGWLSPATAEGTVSPGEPTNIGVEVSPEGLAAGIYRGLLSLQFGGELTRTVQVVLVVSQEVQASLKPSARVSQGACSRAELAPVFKVLGSTSPIPAGWPANIEVEVVDNCADKMADGSVVVDFTNISSSSLALAHLGSGLWGATWNVPSAVGPDSQAVVKVTVTDPAGISAALTQALSVSPNPSAAPRVSPGGVVHSASFVADPLAPGTIVSIFGSNLSSQPVNGGGLSASSVPLSTELAGTQIILGGRPLPMLFSREDQVNAVLPFEVADRLNESLLLLARRTDTASLAMPEPVLVTAARPGVFSQNASGSGPGSIQNASFQIVTPARPVKAGDAIIIYGAGLGSVAPEVASGDPAPSSPLARTAEDVRVTIGARSARVLFAGLTPGFTSLYQVNAVVPAGVPPGVADVVVSIAGQASPVVTLAVE